jgi:CubicO group peptidase (beta-lactamase class C family)
MTTNALPADIRFVGNEVEPTLGTSWGLGFAVRVDETFSQVPGSVGSYGWQSNRGTHFWIDPSEQLIIVMMPQAEAKAFPYYNEDHTMITFVRDGDGKVSRMVLNPGSWERPGVRLSDP